MQYPLLISLDVLEFIEQLLRSTRLALRGVILKISQDPLGMSDVTAYDSTERVVQIAAVGEYALN